MGLIGKKIPESGIYVFVNEKEKVIALKLL